jgi:hypothetical protein
LPWSLPSHQRRIDSVAQPSAERVFIKAWVGAFVDDQPAGLRVISSDIFDLARAAGMYLEDFYVTNRREGSASAIG